MNFEENDIKIILLEELDHRNDTLNLKRICKND